MMQPGDIAKVAAIPHVVHTGVVDDARGASAGGGTAVHRNGGQGATDRRRSGKKRIRCRGDRAGNRQKSQRRSGQCSTPTNGRTVHERSFRAPSGRVVKWEKSGA